MILAIESATKNWAIVIVVTASHNKFVPYLTMIHQGVYLGNHEIRRDVELTADFDRTAPHFVQTTSATFNNTHKHADQGTSKPPNFR
ncbi:hypothetical protein IQ26_05696 [Mesorhizobium tianshanense]|uniref:Uncharacterized protein n=1 Tax=Mesorhizobium tianshanense TaxID=39844 RepID=A0A562N4I2_9HYPH|nr:hypothetical protein IQ26_05696 [Mesorhizobium tianshanense]